jgi:hypothetical protein
MEGRRKPKKLRGSGHLSSLQYGNVAAIPFRLNVCRLRRHANMDNDWLDGNWASSYSMITPYF